MFLSRTFAIAALAALATAPIAHVAETPAFTIMANNSAGKPILFQSTSALKKGDVIKVHAFNALPVMILQMAMCDSDCPHMHLVKTVPLISYFIGISNMNQNIVLPENGHVFFWVQQAGGVANIPIGTASGVWNLQLVDPFLSFTTPKLYLDTQPMPVSALKLDDNTLRARFYHRTFVTVSLADAAI